MGVGIYPGRHDAPLTWPGRYLPPQHGAWAFLAVPLLLAAPLSGAGWVLAPFAVAWVAAYPWSYFALQWWRAPVSRRGRYTRPLAVWTAVVLPLAVLLLVLRPWLVWAGLLWGAAFAVSALFARRNDERSLANDLVQVGQSASVIPVVTLLGLGAFSLAPPPPDLVPHGRVAAHGRLRAVVHGRHAAREVPHPRAQGPPVDVGLPGVRPRSRTGGLPALPVAAAAVRCSTPSAPSS